jgi:hypothetical protein
MTRAREVTKEEEDWIKDNLHYDPETGHIWWTKRGLARQFDKPVGTLTKDGYICLRLISDSVSRQCANHRVAWFLYYGVWPKDQIDHINNIRTDNRVVNLREASQKENNGNMKKRRNCSSNYKGIYWDNSCNKWICTITIDYSRKYLGSYHNEEEAALAYNKAALEYFGEYAKINDLTP